MKKLFLVALVVMVAPGVVLAAGTTSSNQPLKNATWGQVKTMYSNPDPADSGTSVIAGILSTCTAPYLDDEGTTVSMPSFTPLGNASCVGERVDAIDPFMGCDYECKESYDVWSDIRTTKCKSLSGLCATYVFTRELFQDCVIQMTPNENGVTGVQCTEY